MSAEIESLNVESAARRTGGGSPMALTLAVIALVLALAAHWRFNRFDDRVDGVRNQLTELRELQRRSAERTEALAAQVDRSADTLRGELAGLRMVPGQLAELGSTVEELAARTEAPQRAWARAEALYLLELAQRRIELERDVRTAIVAMESADARLSTVNDPAITEVRRELAVELAALRAVPLPDLPQVLARILAVEQAATTLPIQGVALPVAARTAPAATPELSGFARFWQRLGEAWHGLFSLRRVDADTSTLVTSEAESLRRQHFELLLLGARTAAVQQDGAAYVQSLRAAAAWLERYFDASGSVGMPVLAELESLAAVNLDPPRPSVGAAARTLRDIVQKGAATP
jgi:uroporphyrin-3 C-methyltransferase